MPDIPLVVPEINGQETKKSKLIANPNCTTAIGLMALWPLHKLFGLKKIIMSTYQAASGAGQPGMDELQQGTMAYLEGKTVKNEIFAHPLPFNVIPQIDKFQDNGYTKEEMKVTWEARKICDLGEEFPVRYDCEKITACTAVGKSLTLDSQLLVLPHLVARQFAFPPFVPIRNPFLWKPSSQSTLMRHARHWTKRRESNWWMIRPSCCIPCRSPPRVPTMSK